MSGDTLVYEASNSSEGSSSIFVKKDWISIQDSQLGNYRGNQSVIETSQLSNSNKYMNYREGYLAVPMLLTATGAGVNDPSGTASSMDYAFGLKNWFGQIIHSMTLDLGGTTIVQQTNFLNFWNHFKLITSLSWGDVQTMGSSIGFYPDSALSVFRSGTVTANVRDGVVSSTCNNRNLIAFPVVAGSWNGYDSGNVGFLKRQQFINYDPDGLTDGTNTLAFNTMLTATACNQLYKSYIFNKVDDCIQIAIMGIIELRHLHSFFQNVPLMKGVFMKMTLNLNQPQTSINLGTAGATITILSNTNPQGGTNPLMMASCATNNGASSAVAGAINMSLVVGNQITWSAHNATAGVLQSPFNNTIQLYVPAYTFNPVYEQAYLSQPIKKIVYTDVYQYAINNISANGQINQLVTNGVSGLKSVLVVPFYTSASNGGVAPYQSPFDSASGTTSPLCLLTNFQVVVSGQNMIYNTQKYSYETFMNQLSGVNAVNAGLTDGLTSGLVGQLDFETAYCYHYVNCSRMLPVEESVPKSVTIQGTNTSALSLDLFVFCEYGVEISVDVISGARV